MRFNKLNNYKTQLVNGGKNKVGEIVKTTDGRIMYAIDLEDTIFLRWLYEYKDNEYIAKDNQSIELLLWRLQESVGLIPNLIVDSTNIDNMEQIALLKKQIKQLLEE